MEKSFSSIQFKGLLIGLSFVLLMTGCLQTRSELKQTDTKKTVQDQVITLQKNTADQTSRFTDIDSDLRNVNGRVEVLENRVAQYQAQAYEKQGADIQNLDRKVTALQEEITRLNGMIENMTADMNAMKAGAQAKLPEPAGSQGNLGVADELFSKKEWRKAVLVYQKFRDLNPKSKRFPKATLRIGQCFLELGMKDDARTFFEEVIANFPKSEEAKQAKVLLKKK